MNIIFIYMYMSMYTCISMYMHVYVHVCVEGVSYSFTVVHLLGVTLQCGSLIVDGFSCVTKTCIHVYVHCVHATDQTPQDFLQLNGINKL